MIDYALQGAAIILAAGAIALGYHARTGRLTHDERTGSVFGATALILTAALLGYYGLT